MSIDPLEQLTKLTIPPPPRNLEHGVHQRLNGQLLVRDFADLARCGVPFTIQHFVPAMLGVLVWTLLGGPPGGEENKPSEPPADSGGKS